MAAFDDGDVAASDGPGFATLVEFGLEEFARRMLPISQGSGDPVDGQFGILRLGSSPTT